MCSEKSPIQELGYNRVVEEKVVVVPREFTTSQFTHAEHTIEGMFVSTLPTVL
jgi:hypothetical protein